MRDRFPKYLPREISLFGITFPIEEVSSEELEEAEGDTSFNPPKIRIREGMTIEKNWSTLCHEINHVISQESGLGRLGTFDKLEEIIASLFGYASLELIRLAIEQDRAENALEASERDNEGQKVVPFNPAL